MLAAYRQLDLFDATQLGIVFDALPRVSPHPLWLDEVRVCVRACVHVCMCVYACVHVCSFCVRACVLWVDVHACPYACTLA